MTDSWDDIASTSHSHSASSLPASDYFWLLVTEIRSLAGKGEAYPRANRHYLPGYIGHITHRCHQQEFLLQFARDRQA